MRYLKETRSRRKIEPQLRNRQGKRKKLNRKSRRDNPKEERANGEEKSNGFARAWQKASRYAAIVVAAVFCALAIRFFGLISQYAVNLFFSDQWDFNNATVFEHHSLWEMFRWQHGPHRQGLGAIVSHLIEPHFAWNSRTESFLIGGLIVISAACALWLKARLFGSITCSDICIPLILFTPAQYGQVFVVANWSHGPLVLFLVILYGIAWTIPSLPWRYGFVVVINFLTIYTGFGLLLGLITPFMLTADFAVRGRHADRGKIYFAGAVLLSLASFASFFSGYAYVTAVGCKPNLFQQPLMNVEFISMMWANVIGVRGLHSYTIGAGAMLAASLLGALAWNFRNILKPQNPIVSRYLVGAALLAYPLLFCATTAYGRTCLGLQEAQVSRYVMYMEIGLLGLYFSVLTIEKSLIRAGLLVVLALLLASTVPVRTDDEFSMNYYKTFKEEWKACYLARADITFCDSFANQWIQADPEEPGLKSKLDYLQRTKQNLYADDGN